MGLFGRKKKEEVTDTRKSAEKVIFEMLKEDDAKADELLTKLKEGNPLCLNFKELDEIGANKMLAFFAGATRALDGKSISINKTVYLFALRTDFIDGSLQELIIKIRK